jgi:ATP phosphoribosyltransferase regulatory subunit
MSKWKTHTPDGVFDLLEKECYIKRQVESTIAQVFHSRGYFEIQTPTFEFYDTFAHIEQSQMIKFFDKNGRILSLRPDLTTPIARIFATKYADETLPKRVSYIGSAFRETDAVAGTLQKEFTQAGIEFIGESCPEADAEVIATTIKAFLACGLEKFQIDIGQAEFFKGIMEQAKLDGEAVESLRKLIDQKSFAAVESLVEGYNIKPGIKELILELPNFFGGVEVIEKAKEKPLGKRAGAALDNITEVYSILKDYGFEKYISIDLAMVQGLNYYTGIIVKGFTEGVGFPICGGGRYDNLIGEYGKPVPATGVAIGIERLISALNYNNVEFEAPQVHTLVCYEKERAIAFKIADGLRSSGLCVEVWTGREGAKAYANARGIGGIVKVVDGDTIDIINLNDGEITRTSINDLLGGEE